MGWAWYVNDLFQYLPVAETMADTTPVEYEVEGPGVSPDVPLRELDLELEEVMHFPPAPPGPAETEHMGGILPAYWHALKMWKTEGRLHQSQGS